MITDKLKKKDIYFIAEPTIVGIYHSIDHNFIMTITKGSVVVFYN
jgi:hypothetical protein